MGVEVVVVAGRATICPAPSKSTYPKIAVCCVAVVVEVVPVPVVPVPVPVVPVPVPVVPVPVLLC